MPQTREETVAERVRLKAEFGELFDATAALFFRHDPVGINFDFNTDEYELEVGTVLPRLRVCRSEADVCQALHEEFVDWFGAGTAGPLDHYKPVVTELWTLYRSSTTPNHALQRTSHGVDAFHSNPRWPRHGASLSLGR